MSVQLTCSFSIYKKSAAIATAGKTRPTRGTKIDGKNVAMSFSPLGSGSPNSEVQRRQLIVQERTNKLTIKNDRIILNILDNGIDVTFRKGEYGYIGEVNTYSNGIKVLSSITLNEEKYTSFDQGIDSNGKVVWGDVQGPFIFHHT